MSTRRLAQLKRQLKKAHITQDRIAAEVGCDRTHVCHVLAGRFTSSPVLEAAARLLAEATQGGPPASSSDRLASLIADPDVRHAATDDVQAAMFAAARRK